MTEQTFEQCALVRPEWVNKILGTDYKGGDRVHLNEDQVAKIEAAVKFEREKAEFFKQNPLPWTVHKLHFNEWIEDADGNEVSLELVLKFGVKP